MADAFIVRRGGGGGTKLFAAIGVTYPAGSTLTCTNGTKTLKAKTTSGQWVFAIPEAGTWTVTATDGTSTKSESVSITTEGQSVKVELNYRLWLYKDGEQKVAWAGYDQGGVNGATLQSGYMRIIPNGYKPYLYTPDKVNTAGYSTLGIEYKSRYSRGSGLKFGTSNYSYLGGNYNVSYVSQATVLDSSETVKTAKCPIVSGLFNIVLQSDYEEQSLSNPYIYIYNVWLE